MRKACFGQDLLDSYEDDITEFKEEYVKAGLSITMKTHILFLLMSYTFVRSMERVLVTSPNKPGKYLLFDRSKFQTSFLHSHNLF